MAEDVKTPKASQTDKLVSLIEGLNQRVDELSKKHEDFVTKSSQPATATPFYATTGPIGGDSKGFSVLKAAGVAMGFLSRDQAKNEMDICDRLTAVYKGDGFKTHTPNSRGSFLVPYWSDAIPTHTDEGAKLAVEVKQKMLAGNDQVDPNEARYYANKSNYVTKALGTFPDTAGGTLVGFPTLGEMIDLQRNMEVFAKAGASEQALPANARIQYPKLMGGATAYWVGEAAAITSSQQTTGSLDLVGKKLAVLVPINNELIRYANPSVEAMVRNDMAQVSALKADLAMLEGTGGTQILGLLNYNSASSWTVDKLITYTVTSNKFQPEDVTKIVGKLPDPVQDRELTWVMRNDLWGVIAARRADAVSAADGKGPFVFNLTRDIGAKIPKQFQGYQAVTSSQVSNTRGSGSQTYVLCGYFKDWIIGRFGVMEFLANQYGDTVFSQDQTNLRAIQTLDAGARHPASFCLADAIDIS